jgi:hypothetical protein
MHAGPSARTPAGSGQGEGEPLNEEAVRRRTDHHRDHRRGPAFLWPPRLRGLARVVMAYPFPPLTACWLVPLARQAFSCQRVSSRPGLVARPTQRRIRSWPTAHVLPVRRARREASTVWGPRLPGGRDGGEGGQSSLVRPGEAQACGGCARDVPGCRPGSWPVSVPLCWLFHRPRCARYGRRPQGSWSAGSAAGRSLCPFAAYCLIFGAASIIYLSLRWRRDHPPVRAAADLHAGRFTLRGALCRGVIRHRALPACNPVTNVTRRISSLSFVS